MRQLVATMSDGLSCRCVLLVDAVRTLYAVGVFSSLTAVLGHPKFVASGYPSLNSIDGLRFFFGVEHTCAVSLIRGWNPKRIRTDVIVESIWKKSVSF